MPRQARIDAPSAVHHLIIRGIEKTAIFADDQDRENFIERLSELLAESQTPCYAWALLGNHAHLLLRTGGLEIAWIMRRLLTGYAVRFNRRHRRHGHLFQNRYKSILCEEDRYLKQLVVYIHLNPVRAGIVENIKALKSFAFTGHSALMGRALRPWQDTDYVLSLFGRRVSDARRNLQRQMLKWAAKGRRPELTGGGLIRSSGGWRAVKEAYRQGIRLASDERLLGSSKFVERTLKAAGEAYDRRMRRQSAGIDLSSMMGAVCRYLGVEEKELAGPSKQVKITQARALIGYMATQDLSISGSEVGRRLNIDRSAVSRAVQRARHDAQLMADANSIWKLIKAPISQQ
jgi:putative transposase